MPLSGRMVHWFPLHSRFFFCNKKAHLSIHIFTWQSRANASLIHSIHSNTFAPFTRIVANKFWKLPGLPKISPHFPRSSLATSREVLSLWIFIGNEKSARSFSDRSFFEPPWGHGRPRLRVMDARTEILVFQDFECPDRSFGPGYPHEWHSDVRGISGPETYSWAAFSFLI